MFDMFEPTLFNWVALGISAVLIAVSKTGIPGVGILAIVMMLFVLPAKASVGLLLPILIAGDVIAVAYYRRHAVWRHIVRLAPWAVGGILVGYYALGRINDGQLRRIIGGIVLALLALEWWRNRDPGRPIPTQWWFAAVIGVLAGFTTMIGNAAGPLTIIYFLAMRLDKHEFVGTSAWYFLLLNTFKVPFMCARGMITPESLQINLILLPAVGVGAVAGIFVLKRIRQRAFVIAARVLTVAAALWLLLGDLIGAALNVKQ